MNVRVLIDKMASNSGLAPKRTSDSDVDDASVPTPKRTCDSNEEDNDEKELLI